MQHEYSAAAMKYSTLSVLSRTITDPVYGVLVNLGRFPKMSRTQMGLLLLCMQKTKGLQRDSYERLLPALLRTEGRFIVLMYSAGDILPCHWFV